MNLKQYLVFTGFVSLVGLPSQLFAQSYTPVAGPLKGVKRLNTSRLLPAPEVKLTFKCPWITSMMNQFDATHAGWDYTWASQAQQRLVAAGIKVLNYDAYVVEQPDVLAANGINFPSTTVGLNDLGGAVLNLSYMPVMGAPEITNLNWIQAYIQTTKGVSGTFLDNNNQNAPFYNGPYTAGTLAKGGGWFLDTPYDSYGNYNNNPNSTVQFQVVVANFNPANKFVTLYGGIWWGYTYSTEATNTPAVPGAVVWGLVALAQSRLRRARSRPATLA